jgi:putative ABC transport system permease protein
LGQIAVMNRDRLINALDSYKQKNGKPHPLADKTLNLVWLKVLGFQPRHVLLLVLGEALLVGLLGGGMSSLLAYAMLGSFKFQIMFFGAFFVPAKALVYGPALGMAVSLAGSIVPAMTAKDVKVAEVFARVA